MYAANFGDEGVTCRRGVMQPTRAPCHIEIETLAEGVREAGSETIGDIGNSELEATAYDVRITEYLSRDCKRSIGWD